MAYIVICVATRWGSSLGGINVFNTGLAQGIANILPQASQCICVVEEQPARLPNSKIKLVISKLELTLVVNALIEEIEKLPSRDIEEVLLIGHDLKTGELVVSCAKELRTRLTHEILVKSAVISHMDYREYARRKGQALPDVMAKSEKQHQIVASADHAFAVGPLLATGFQSARSNRNDRVISLTPGSSDIKPASENENSLNFYIGGRLGLEDDQIKNGVLAVRAVIAAYRDKKSDLSPGRWTLRGHFYACGVDLTKDASLLELLKDEARKENAFELETIPFSDNQDELHQYLARSDVALMPSWHEGFGLTGWEALCAGVPLVCSSQSGLALLIDQLRRRLPDADFLSVEPVQLTGGTPAGMPSEDDIKILSSAIKNIVSNYSARKAAALKLATRIKGHFTWSRCAAELIGQIHWPWANPGDWFQRQQVAHFAAESSDSVAGTIVVLEALEVCRSENVESEWARVCFALNFFSDVGANVSIRERQSLTKNLLEIGTAISKSLKNRNFAMKKHPIANTVFSDLCWRYMAAASRLAMSFSEFAQLILPSMLNEIFSDNFLLREFLFYVCRFSLDFCDSASDVAKKFFKPLASYFDKDRSLCIRLARLITVYPNLHKVIDISGNANFDAEIQRCKRAISKPYDISQLLSEDVEIASTVLAIAGLKPDITRQSVDQPIELFKRLDSKNFVTKTWRGDKRLAAGMLTVVVSSSKIFTVLKSMATDEEEAIRWAALDLCFSPVLRARLESWEISLSSRRTLYAQLGEIVDLAVNFGDGHPWLAREFLNHFREEYVQPSLMPEKLSKFVLTDFPCSRGLLGPSVKPEWNQPSCLMHPEVEDARTKALEIIKRVLLILPPISINNTPERAASKTSTPPLGLGLLGTHLSQLGHDVHLVDCHRFPEIVDHIFSRSKTFDLIGFNTVFSTVRSTRRMLSQIRSATQRPVLVVGGPAANLDGWRFSAQEYNDQSNWDFAISNDAVRNLTLLVDSLKTSQPWPSSYGLHPNPRSSFVALRDVDSKISLTEDVKNTSSKDLGWMKIHLDRRLYNGPNGQYEPNRTRDINSRVYEAHIVMSTGCDWNCSFCTERLNLSNGERRRTVKSVLHEVRHLAAHHSNLRIQFIDDNLFPQIASPINANRIKLEEGVAWAESFLTGLKTIRNELNGKLTWRGIFRLEDFDAYEKQGEEGGFLRVLSEAGCNMLAFGVESGNPDRRHSMKAGGRKFTNDVITNLFQRLRDVGIFTKAYFILGGPKETAQSTEQTISFAVNSGASIAYFALYKDFVLAQKELRKERVLGDQVAASLLNYEQLLSAWDDAFLTPSLETDQNQTNLHTPPSASEYLCYKKLASMGFRFEDLVKYNDYHAKDGPAGERLKYLTWGKPNEFFAFVENAYRKFYLREEFVINFKQLVAAGY